MPELVIPKQDIAVTKWHNKKTDQDVPIYTFAAEMDGKLLPACQVFGGDRGPLDEAMNSGKPLVCESVTHNAERQRYDVKLPRQGGGGWQKGGEKRPFVPQGYKGQPVPYDVWVKHTADVMVQMVTAILAGAGQLPANVPAMQTDTVLQEARSLVAQYWMSVERNITFVPSLEPRAEAAQPATQAAPAATPLADGSWESRIAALGTVDACVALMTAVREECQDDEMRARLIKAVFERQKVIQGVR